MHSPKVPHRLSLVLEANNNLAGNVLQSYNCSFTISHGSNLKTKRFVKLTTSIHGYNYQFQGSLNRWVVATYG